MGPGDKGGHSRHTQTTLTKEVETLEKPAVGKIYLLHNCVKYPTSIYTFAYDLLETSCLSRAGENKIRQVGEDRSEWSGRS